MSAKTPREGHAMLKGPMIIDLGKARKAKAALHAAAAMLDWQGWNSANPAHPKGSDGRWVTGHPGVTNLGEMPDHVHHLSDDDLAASHGHARSLITAIEAEQARRTPGARANAGVRYETIEGRRVREAAEVKPKNPAKPLTARGRQVPAEVSAELDEMVRHPMNSDRDRMKELLSGMTVAQIHEFVGRHMDVPTQGRNKADLVNQAIEHTVGFKLNSEAIRHGISGGVGERDPLGDRRAIRLREINEALRAADLRGDRAEHERLHHERVALAGRYAMEPGAGPNKPAEPSVSTFVGDGPAPLAARLKELPATGEGTEQARAMLQGMTVPELKKLRAEIGPTVSRRGTTKRQIVDDIAEGTVGFRARAAAMGSAWQGEGKGPDNPTWVNTAADDVLSPMTKANLMAEYSGKGPKIHREMTKPQMIEEIKRWKAGEPARAAARAKVAQENKPFIKYLEGVRGELPDRNYGKAVDEILEKLRSGEEDRWAAYNRAGTSKVMRTDMGAERAQGHRIMDDFREFVEASEEEGWSPKA